MLDLRRAALPRTIFCALIAAACLLCAAVLDDASARRRGERYYPSIGTRLNANTVYVISGNLNATYISIAYDLSAVLDDGDNLRILPVIGKGGGQNIKDVRFLKGVDVGITQAPLLKLFQKNNTIGPLQDQIVYIARLFNEEMHVIVRAESGINSIKDLNGKKVNFSDIGSGTQLSTRDIFARLGIKATEVNMGQADAFEALKKGEIAATVLIAGKPTGSTSKLRAADGFRILPVPYTKELQDDYLPTTLTHADYPNLIEQGHDIDAVAVGAVLIAYNWPTDTDRYRRIAKFVEAFFPRLEEFKRPPRHPKWKEANLTATIPGWKRFPAAEEWVKKHRSMTAEPKTRQDFERFLASDSSGIRASVTPEERERLFEKFIEWRRTHGAQ